MISTGCPRGWGCFLIKFLNSCVSRIQGIYQGGLDLVFPAPKSCLVCGGSLGTRALIELCQSCLGRLRLVKDDCCKKCGRPQPPVRTYCHDCAELQHFFVKNRAVAIYDGALKEQIREVKYQYNRRLGIALGQILGFVAHRMAWVPRDAFLVAVPLHETRLRRRGYNQAELILQGAMEYLNRPLLAPGSIIRRDATGASSHLGPKERRANLRGAFEVTRPAAMDGKVLCVVDDIYTTGATLDEMARVLLYAGAKEIHGLTLAIAITDQDILDIAPSPQRHGDIREGRRN